MDDSESRNRQRYEKVGTLVIEGWNCYDIAYRRALHSGSVKEAVHHLLTSYIDKVNAYRPGCLEIELKILTDYDLAMLLKNFEKLASSMQEAVSLEAAKKLQKKLHKRKKKCADGSAIVKTLLLVIISQQFRVQLNISIKDVKDFHAATNNNITLIITTTTFKLAKNIWPNVTHNAWEGLQKEVKRMWASLASKKLKQSENFIFRNQLLHFFFDTSG